MIKKNVKIFQKRKLVNAQKENRIWERLSPGLRKTEQEIMKPELAVYGDNKYIIADYFQYSLLVDKRKTALLRAVFDLCLMFTFPFSMTWTN